MMNQTHASPVTVSAQTATRFGVIEHFPVIPAQAATEVGLIERLLDIPAQAVTMVGLTENSPVIPAQAGIQKTVAPVIK